MDIRTPLTENHLQNEHPWASSSLIPFAHRYGAGTHSTPANREFCLPPHSQIIPPGLKSVWWCWSSWQKWSAVTHQATLGLAWVEGIPSIQVVQNCLLPTQQWPHQGLEKVLVKTMDEVTAKHLFISPCFSCLKGHGSKCIYPHMKAHSAEFNWIHSKISALFLHQ